MHGQTRQKVNPFRVQFFSHVCLWVLGSLWNGIVWYMHQGQEKPEVADEKMQSEEEVTKPGISINTAPFPYGSSRTWNGPSLKVVLHQMKLQLKNTLAVSFWQNFFQKHLFIALLYLIGNVATWGAVVWFGMEQLLTLSVFRVSHFCIQQPGTSF
jgi:hypothetical protein